jgi:hypothetical protein
MPQALQGQSCDRHRSISEFKDENVIADDYFVVETIFSMLLFEGFSSFVDRFTCSMDSRLSQHRYSIVKY